MNKIKKGS